MEVALNETIVQWRKQSNWTMGFDSALNPKVGILPYRGVYGPVLNHVPWDEWLVREPLDDPTREPVFWFADARQNNRGPHVTNYLGFAGEGGFSDGDLVSCTAVYCCVLVLTSHLGKNLSSYRCCFTGSHLDWYIQNFFQSGTRI